MADEETSRVSAERAPIRINCTLPGREGQHAIFKATGWKFKHRRLWENEISVEGLALIVAERIESWRLLDEVGEEIPFQPKVMVMGQEQANPAVFDELHPEVSSWLIMVFRQAYQEAGRPNPNA
jgi:hypothetical protein